MRIEACVTILLLAALMSVQASAYEIGHTSITYYDPDRGDRSIPTEIYYPADTAGDDVPVAASPPEGFPAVSFGHGYTMSWELYDYVREGLVPDGYIVAYPKTEQVLFPDHLDLGLDLAFVLSELRLADVDPGSIFYGCVAQKTAALGHSMGGGAAVLAASEDSTVSAVANLAAAETNPSAIAAAATVTAPALLFSGGNDCVVPASEHQIPIYEALATDCKTRVMIEGASHCQFAEYSFACAFGEQSCDDPTITREEQQDSVIALLTPWLDFILKDDVDGWLLFSSLLDSTAGLTYQQECIPASVEGWTADGDDADGDVLHLSAAFPNPTSGGGRVRYALPRSGHVRALIYSLSGRLVATLKDGPEAPGTHELYWDGKDTHGHPVASGVYCFRVEAGGETESSAVVVIR